MAIFGGEAMEHVEDLVGFEHGLTNVMQSIGEAFEFAYVGCDVHVPLNQVVKLSFKIDGTMELMTVKLGLDGAPNFVGRGFGGVHDGTNIFGDGIVKLAKDALIRHDPVGITAICGGGCDSEVGGEAKFADEGVKEILPFGVVGLGDVELNRDMMADVDGL